ncbi:unnamed protein product [Prorocentrum cordatum]|uniref:Uncharacterized protein n=1 Tax=Prorocentrum cordatum TaxID=2364126 RepID=A0ABN9QPS4_9DINO|nr:unnamed protein product [Polarella glacialis]
MAPRASRLAFERVRRRRLDGGGGGGGALARPPLSSVRSGGPAPRGSRRPAPRQAGGRAREVLQRPLQRRVLLLKRRQALHGGLLLVEDQRYHQREDQGALGPDAHGLYVPHVARLEPDDADPLVREALPKTPVRDLLVRRVLVHRVGLAGGAGGQLEDPRHVLVEDRDLFQPHHRNNLPLRRVDEVQLDAILAHAALWRRRRRLRRPASAPWGLAPPPSAQGGCLRPPAGRPPALGGPVLLSSSPSRRCQPPPQPSSGCHSHQSSLGWEPPGGLPRAPRGAALRVLGAVAVGGGAQRGLQELDELAFEPVVPQLPEQVAHGVLIVEGQRHNDRHHHRALVALRPTARICRLLSCFSLTTRTSSSLSPRLRVSRRICRCPRRTRTARPPCPSTPRPTAASTTRARGTRTPAPATASGRSRRSAS